MLNQLTHRRSSGSYGHYTVAWVLSVQHTMGRDEIWNRNQSALKCDSNQRP